MARWFISCAGEDYEAARQLKTALMRIFTECLVFLAPDPDSTPPGDQFRQSIRAALVDCDGIIVLLTQNSIGRPWIHWECGVGDRQGIVIIPLLGPGITSGHLPDTLAGLQAISLEPEGSGLDAVFRRVADTSAWAYGEAHWDTKALAGDLLNSLKKFAGKRWIGAAEGALHRFLKTAPPGTQCCIRAIGYTTETMARSLGPMVDRLLAQPDLPNRPIDVKVLLRSEYAPFTVRAHAHGYNRRVRMRISRAKADWYEWNEISNLSDSHAPVNLEVRDYASDPTLKALLLGQIDGFLGFYAFRDQHIISDAPGIPPAPDWLAEETEVTRLDRSNHPLVGNLTRWFEYTWSGASHRPNEEYRCKRSRILLDTLGEKADALTAMCRTHSPEQRLVHRWSRPSDRTSSTHRWLIGNLAIPASYPETSDVVIDCIGTVMMFFGARGSVVLCELRGQGESWEAIGKTSTYLDLLGVEPVVFVNGRRLRAASLEELRSNLASLDGVRWSHRRSRRQIRLIASDFLWFCPHEGGLGAVRPEGELLWGLWDCARYLLRRCLLADKSDGSAPRTPLWHEIQGLLFRGLPLSDLEPCYDPNTGVVPVTAVFLVYPGSSNSKPICTKAQSPEETRAWLRQAFESGPHHPSPFWLRHGQDIAVQSDVARRLVDTLDDRRLPVAYKVAQAKPYRSMAKVISQKIQEMIV